VPLFSAWASGPAAGVVVMKTSSYPDAGSYVVRRNPGTGG
jgi:hypothetical protein